MYKIALTTRAMAEIINSADMFKIHANVAVRNAINENILLNDITWLRTNGKNYG